MRDGIVYCSDDHLHLLPMPYSDEAMRRMAHDLALMRNWLVTGRTPYYEVPAWMADRIISRTLRVTHRQLVLAVELTLNVS